MRINRLYGILPAESDGCGKSAGDELKPKRLRRPVPTILVHAYIDASDLPE
jgi:hypothetical protein